MSTSSDNQQAELDRQALAQRERERRAHQEYLDREVRELRLARERQERDRQRDINRAK